MELQVEKTKQKKVEYTVVARITGLTAVYDGTETHTDNAGVIPMTLSAGGPPMGLAAGGTISTFAIPLLALTVPTSPPGADGNFPVAAFGIARLGTFAGSGHLDTTPRGETITLRLTMGAGEAAPRYDVVSQFREAGELAHAAGTFADGNGALKFTVIRR